MPPPVPMFHALQSALVLALALAAPLPADPPPPPPPAFAATPPSAIADVFFPGTDQEAGRVLLVENSLVVALGHAGDGVATLQRFDGSTGQWHDAAPPRRRVAGGVSTERLPLPVGGGVLLVRWKVEPAGP